MAMSDPIADMLTRIRNGQARGKTSISMPSSKQKVAIANLLKQEGYLSGFAVEGGEEEKPTLVLKLNVFSRKPVLEQLKRVLRPGLRIYGEKNRTPLIRREFGATSATTGRNLYDNVVLPDGTVEQRVSKDVVRMAVKATAGARGSQ
ncbi:uS8 family ribosomal protein [Thiohalocapsa sp. ML1]|jgi:small subunit ribosomal protein S8|uniref:uS8 family ribosomal protein n=1 Tax=Thiohalocapsa sp. ML1 TaxID=1431688 RepID=UPI0009E9C9A6|nr:30S ribosomal protein S8 [Thiohalocapsa sp. ML1]